MFEKNNIGSTWMTTNDAARYLGKSKNALWLLVSRGLLIKRKWQGRLYFKKSEIDRMLETALV
jgi:hypothetical protein